MKNIIKGRLGYRCSETGKKSWKANLERLLEISEYKEKEGISEEDCNDHCFGKGEPLRELSRFNESIEIFKKLVPQTKVTEKLIQACKEENPYVMAVHDDNCS